MNSKRINNIDKPKLWIVTELFYPDQTSTAYILSKIANKMTEKYSVHVITPKQLYQNNSEISDNYLKLNNSIEIIRVKTGKLNKNNLILRLLRIFALSNLLYNELKQRINYNEHVLIVTNPVLLMLKCAELKKQKNIVLNILIHDVFPENTVPAGLIPFKTSYLFKIISNKFNHAYSAANKLIVLGVDMKEVVAKKVSTYFSKPEIIIIENWGDVENITPNIVKSPLINARHQNNTLTIQYAGNIGRVQGLEYFIDILFETHNKNILFDLWGNGALQKFLINKIKIKRMDNFVNFYGNYSRTDQNYILNSMDIALITLANGMYGLGVPSKTYNIIAAGKPILFIGDIKSEVAQLINRESIGFCFSSEDKKGIIDFLDNLTLNKLPLLEEMGKKARIVAENQYSENFILNKFLENI